MKLKNPAIYVRNYCFFCARVMREIQQLGMDMEVKNIWENPDYERELRDAMRRTTVPVLYYEDEEGKSVWLPESTDIIEFLRIFLKMFCFESDLNLLLISDIMIFSSVILVICINY